jgi:short-subunit dehydrogenase
MNLNNQQILITGANRGIGLALAKMCAGEKAHLHLVTRKDHPELIKDMQDRGAVSVKNWVADLSSKEGTQDLISRLQGQTIDILINNAGQLTGGLIEEQPVDEIYSMFHVNLLSLIQLTRGLIPGMISRKKGKIVNNASVSALMHFPCASTYAASKAAILAFTNCIHTELKKTGVSTLCLFTPGIRTRMFGEIERKYGKNLEIPSEAISTDSYAEKVKEAIVNDRVYLFPEGSNRLGLLVNKYFPHLFRWEVERRFRR